MGGPATARGSLAATVSTNGSAPAALPLKDPARIAVMPAYNEEATIEGVLDDLYSRIDRVIIVDDGSRDATPEIVDRWAAARPKATVIHFPENRGLSAALRAGWEEVRAMLARGDISPDDVAFSIDADGQHEPAALDGMIEHLIATDSVCVIGNRDMGYHTPYKKFGNAVMTWIGRISGWAEFHDIESGYRVFRVGPLLEAQEFYEGYKYSETVEVAVILTRLGYRVDNTYRINIPVARTRTRLYDAAVDAVCMPLAWYRLACWRDMPRGARSRLSLLVPAAIVALTVLVLGLMLTRTFYLGDDAAQSYGHVWYLRAAIFTQHQWPWHVAQLENGDAVMFPYGIIPWLPDALLYPIFGGWIVTFSMVLGVALMLIAVGRFRSELRNPFLFSLFLLNPLLWNGITQFQLTTVWAFAFAFFGLAQLERARYGTALAMLAAAIAVHPMMATGTIAIYLAWEWARTRTIPLRAAALSVGAVAIASPSVFLFLSTPLVSEAKLNVIALSFLDNLRRLSVPLLALAIPELRGRIYLRQATVAGALALATVGVLIYLPPSGLWQSTRPRFEGYLAAHPVQPAGSYRVLVSNNHEDGMVEFMRAGATLANEFFTESEHRQVWPDPDAYTCFLATKQVDHVIVGSEYPSPYRESELHMLDILAANGDAEIEYRGDDATAYTVHPPDSARRDSLRSCHL